MSARADLLQFIIMTDMPGVRNLDFAVKSRCDTPEDDQFA